MAVKLMPVAPPPPENAEPQAEKPVRGPRKRRKAAVYDAEGHEVLVSLMCLKCHTVRPLSMFGLRKMADGAIRNQPWCRDCRGKSGHKNKPKAADPAEAAPAVAPPAPEAPPAPAPAVAQAGAPAEATVVAQPAAPAVAANEPPPAGPVANQPPEDEGPDPFNR